MDKDRIIYMTKLMYPDHPFPECDVNEKQNVRDTYVKKIKVMEKRNNLKPVMSAQQALFEWSLVTGNTSPLRYLNTTYIPNPTCNMQLKLCEMICQVAYNRDDLDVPPWRRELIDEVMEWAQEKHDLDLSATALQLTFDTNDWSLRQTAGRIHDFHR
jgi:hypothetical protein